MEGIKASQLAQRLSRLVIERYATNGKSLVILSFFLSFALIFLIPQTFPRVILLAIIYLEFLKQQEVTPEQKSVLLFSAFVATTGTSMAFVNGDIVLNNATMQFAGLSLTWSNWAAYMAVPTIAISALMCLGMLIMFRKQLRLISFTREGEKKRAALTAAEIKATLIIALVVILWATESIHGLKAAWVALIGTVLMAVLGLLKVESLRVIKLDLLIF